jgi:hypothetical protein
MPELLHEPGRLRGRVRQLQQHRLEGRARVGAEQASGRERRQGAGGLLDGQAHLRRDEAALLERHAHVGHFALRLASSSSEQVRDVRDVLALELELGQRGGRDLSRVPDLH